MEAKYSIKVISNSCGVLPHTLRVWEQRYGVFNPERSDGGQRLYSDEDLKKAKLLSYLIGKGHTISKLAGFSLDQLEGLTEVFSDQRLESQNLQIGEHLNKSLLKHLKKFELKEVTQELQFIRMTKSAKDFIFQVVLPVMREIGFMVAKGDLSVTQEHIISTLVREQISQIHLPNIGSREREMAFATPEGNLHELSILIGEVLSRCNRVPTRYLGPAHPADCLAMALNAMKSPYLVLGTVSSDLWNYDKQILPFLKTLDNHLNYPLSVYLGGGKEMEFPVYKNIKSVIPLATFEDFDVILEKEI
ncbi:MAG: MerR family transcriptional regulator [Deltaproteobacteria bacterium]|nr:MAG: MerR family transcriptional regulator [Deltaproteobacteria bacterium]